MINSESLNSYKELGLFLGFVNVFEQKKPLIVVIILN